MLFLSYEDLILDSGPASGPRATEDGDDDAGMQPLRLLLLLRLLHNSHVDHGHHGAGL